MDNKGAGKEASDDDQDGADQDVRHQIAVVAQRSSPKHVTKWIRGHPEKRKPPNKWDRHERAIYDVVAVQSI